MIPMNTIPSIYLTKIKGELLKLVPVGSFMWWLGNVDIIPENWIVCNGQDITMYPELVRVLNSSNVPNITEMQAVIRGNSRPSLYGTVGLDSNDNSVNTISAIPLIKAISSKDAVINLTDSEIQLMLPALTAQIEDLENAIFSVQQQQDEHYVSEIAHKVIFEGYDSEADCEELSSRVGSLTADVEYIEGIILKKETTADEVGQ